ncbi:hypothetical protein ABDK75_10480 [Gluconobacter sp. OJA]|uniref:hypothetical protein n=1 Tax=Gluconobacter sp. OJA TaxID=3145197 RepID=UPI0031F99755
MSVKLQLIEPNVGLYCPEIPFVFNQNGCCVHEIFRILTGSANVRFPNSEKIINLSENQFIGKSWRSSNPKNIFNLLFSDSISIDDYKDLVVNLSRSESDFFCKLRDELLLCLVNKKNKRYTESFLYLYRILELMSVAFPMIYASTQRGFQTSHDFLRALITNEKDGELAVLQKAIPELSKGSILEDLTFDFDISGNELEFIREIKNQINICIKPHIRSLVFEEDGDILFHVHFNDMAKFIVTCRNRIFHYRIKEKNVNLGAIGGADRFFHIIIDQSIKWFSLVLSEVIRALSRKYI